MILPVRQRTINRATAILGQMTHARVHAQLTKLFEISHNLDSENISKTPKPHPAAMWPDAVQGLHKTLTLEWAQQARGVTLHGRFTPPLTQQLRIGEYLTRAPVIGE